MTLKSSAFLALIGMVLVMAVCVWDFILNVLNVTRGVTAPAILFSSIIYAFGAFTVVVFLFVFHKNQS